MKATTSSRRAGRFAGADTLQQLEQLARRVRRQILEATTHAASGHPTSSLSAADLMTALFFGGVFRYDADHPEHPNNDRLIFSKGHASPLFYALWNVAGKIPDEEMKRYRQFGSVLEGHPTPDLPFVEAATGSLGQGLSIGVGMAMNARFLDRLPYRTYVLLGDGEMAEGSQWEAIALAAHYELDNLVGILDVNRLGQCGETMHGHDLDAYAERIGSFGWETLCIDGHSLLEILDAFETAAGTADRPVMIIARTLKGKGVAQLEDKTGWHGKAMEEDALPEALRALGAVDQALQVRLAMPEDRHPEAPHPQPAAELTYDRSKQVATRNAYGNALRRLAPKFPQLIALDAEVSNSTMSQELRKEHPDRFFEMFIAEQNMVGAALGLSRRGKIPFVSSFAAFLSRAFDQIRMAQYSNANIKFAGSHAGVSIGEDGPSQMGLEDIALFRTLLGSVVLHPCDAISTEKLVEAAAVHPGIVYLRTLRQKTAILYDPADEFPIGGSRILRQSDRDAVTIVAAGATVHEALAAFEELARDGIAARVIDAYSIKPIDEPTLRSAARETGRIITVEDHYEQGGLGEAVLSALADDPVPVRVLAVRKKPRSGKGAELRQFEGISARAIVAAVKERGAHP